MRSQANTGAAGRKNWEVKGTSRATLKSRGITSLMGYPGTCIKGSQKATDAKWKMYIESDQVKVCLLSRFMVSFGESDLSRRPTAARNALYMVSAVCIAADPGRA